METANSTVSSSGWRSSPEELLKLAKYSTSELKPVCQELIYGEYREDIKLLELDATLLNELEHNSKLTIRGDTSDNAVLCTFDKTYELKQAITSNSLLLAPDLLLPTQIPDGDAENESITVRSVKVFSAIHDYVEARPIQPRLRRIKELLQRRLFSTDGSAAAASAARADDKVTLDSLLNGVQASQAEIVAYLEKIEAFVIDGSWTLLDFDYTTTVLEHVLDLIDENSWSSDCIPLEEVVDTLESIHRREVLRHVCRVFGHLEQDETHFGLNKSRVCRHYGELILRSAGRMHLGEFLECWQQSAPKPMTTSLDDLQGLFLIEETNVSKLIEYFSLDQLSENIDERMALLFKKKARWTMSEIKCYVENETGSPPTRAGATDTAGCRRAVAIRAGSTARPTRPGCAPAGRRHDRHGRVQESSALPSETVPCWQLLYRFLAGLSGSPPIGAGTTGLRSSRISARPTRLGANRGSLLPAWRSAMPSATLPPLCLSFCSDLAEDAASLITLISKHSRSYLENGQRYFCLKK